MNSSKAELPFDIKSSDKITTCDELLLLRGLLANNNKPTSVID